MNTITRLKHHFFCCGKSFLFGGLFLVLAFEFTTGILYAEKTEAVDEADYQQSVQPIFSRYCTGCHNQRDAEGELSLESYADLKKGGEDGAILAATAEQSKLVGVIQGTVDPLMPPEGEPRPTDEEIAVLSRWINAGAKGPSTAVERVITTPHLPPAPGKKPACFYY